MARDTNKPGKGVSLAKGPVGILGLIAVIYGISALIFGGHGFALHIPHGAVHGKTWLGLEVNGWSDLLFLAAGALLMFGAPLHWGAKGMSFLVGLALGIAAVIALIRGDGVFGIFAANHLTELVWGAAAVLLILVALLPRVGGNRGTEDRSQPVQRRRRTTATRDADVHRDDAQQHETRQSVGARRTTPDNHDSQ
jgi:hypothetical protein